MNKKISERFDKFADFLYTDPGVDYESSVESLIRFNSALKQQLERANQASKKNWLARAQDKKNQFERTAKEISSEIKKYGSRKELIEAINSLVSGDLGQNYHLQFRNRKIDELSDDDLRAILSDQKILEELSKKK